MLYLRALRNTQIVVRTGHQQGVVLTTETGMHFVEGPKDNEDGTSTPGAIVGVEDDFVVNPEVWEVVRVSADQRDVVVLPYPVKGVKYVQPRAAQPAGGIPVSAAAVAEEMQELREANEAMQKQLAELTKLLQSQGAGGKK